MIGSANSLIDFGDLDVVQRSGCAGAPSTIDLCDRCDVLLGLPEVRVEEAERVETAMTVTVSTPWQLTVVRIVGSWPQPRSSPSGAAPTVRPGSGSCGGAPRWRAHAGRSPNRSRLWSRREARSRLGRWHGYKNAIDEQLEDATAVLDAFHVVKLGTTVLDEVRRRVQQTTTREPTTPGGARFATKSAPDGARSGDHTHTHNPEPLRPLAASHPAHPPTPAVGDHRNQRRIQTFPPELTADEQALIDALITHQSK